MRMEATETASVDAIIAPNSAACCLRSNNNVLHTTKNREDREKNTISSAGSMKTRKIFNV